MGAVIKIKSRIPNRRALMDIGVAGPLAGFAVSVLALGVGMRLSEKIPAATLSDLGTSMELGRSLLSSVLAGIIVGDLPQGYVLYDHPIFVAGWVGLFVTFLNLLPVGQFDGGHIVYAIFGRRHTLISKGTIVLLGLFWAVGPPYEWLSVDDMLSVWLYSRWPGWLVWIFLAMVLGRRHPPTTDPYLELDTVRKAVGCLALVIFVLCFTPMPISFTSP
jgi:membrane-associated protease RseP (regulator of RpoE activity)